MALNESSDKDPPQVSTIRISHGQSNVFSFILFAPGGPYDLTQRSSVCGLDRRADQQHDYCLGVVGTQTVETGVIDARPEGVRIIYHCWKQREIYDEAKYLAALEKRNSPLIKLMAEAA